jgi:O-antigen ligase
MLLNLLSIPELNFSESLKKGWNKINALNQFEKYMTLFWFLGPFVYLIERDPADLWLTLICFIFLTRCIKRKNWSWVNQTWFKSALVLWIIGLFSAITGPDPLFTFQQGFTWIRFPIYVAAAQVWLAKDRDIRVVMLLSILLGMLIMCGILIAESLIKPSERLSWPYGDVVPGGYLAKVSLPLFCTLMTIAVSKKSKASILSGMIVLLCIIVVLLTGERTNFLLLACGGIIASLVWKPRFIIVTSLIFIQIFAVLILILNLPEGKTSRYKEKFLKSIPITNTSDDNPYWGAWRGGIQQGLMTPIKGIGPSGTRNTCANLDTKLPEWLPGKNHCRNHPHNFYIQLFSEVGVIGLLLGCIMFGSLITTCYKARLENFNCPMAATAFIVPLGLFFPIQQFGSFYGQWGNLFTWFAIAFAVSQYQGWRKPKNSLN